MPSNGGGTAQIQIVRRQRADHQRSAGEFDLLLAFVQQPQRVLSRDQLLDLARGRAAGLFDRSIDIQVSRLRRKIEEDPKDPKIIQTIWGGGYKFVGTVEQI